MVSNKVVFYPLFLCKHGQKNRQTWDEWYRMPCWSAIYWITLQHCSSPRIFIDHIMNPKICSMCMMSLSMNNPWNLIQEKKCMNFYGKSVCTDISLSRTRETHPGAIMSSIRYNFVIETQWRIWCSSETMPLLSLWKSAYAKFKCFLGDICLANKLFMSYCTSFSGCRLRDLSPSWHDVICVAWSKAERRIFQLQYNTHYPLLHICLAVYLSETSYWSVVSNFMNV